MGEAKRRKKLDPNFGKGFGRYKQGKQKVQQGKLPERYISLVANKEWHDWSMPPEEIARMEAQCQATGFPFAIIDSMKEDQQKNVEVVQVLAGLLLGEQTILRNNQTPSSELTEIVKGLAEMILADAEHSLSGKRSPFSVNQETSDKTKALGSRLNELGGFDLMRAIATDYVPRCDQKELESIWHGIGDWRA